MRGPGIGETAVTATAMAAQLQRQPPRVIHDAQASVAGVTAATRARARRAPRRSGTSSTTRSWRPGCAPAAPPASWPARRDVLGYDHATSYQPFNIEPTTPPTTASHGEQGCDICTRACPRFRDWETDVRRRAVRPRPRREDEPFGIYQDSCWSRATDPRHCDAGQDGGAGLRAADLGAGDRPDRRRALSNFSTSGTLDAVPARRHRPRGRAAHRRVALHVLRQPARDEGRPRSRACRSARAGRACRARRRSTARWRPALNKYAQADRADHRAALLEDVHLRRAVRRDARRGVRHPARRRSRSTSRASSSSGTARTTRASTSR